MPGPYTDLVEPSELGQWGVPAPFLRQFVPRAVQLKVSTAGVLGTMAVQHRLVGEDNYDPTPLQSSSGTTWDLDLTGDGRWLTLTFAAGTYVVNTTYTVNEAGTVTAGAGAINTVTASRYDLRDNGCEAATEEAYALMRDGITPPLTAWGADVKRHVGAMVHEFLRGSVGMTAEGAGVGDANVLTQAALARAYFADIGKSRILPPSMVDSAVSSDGPIWKFATGDTLRNW